MDISIIQISQYKSKAKMIKTG
uniref:Uncharacterized protein n=1 Tax=Rhizophora mucronata TaxID=61149 RepID=A0A2P2PRM4_RHIMU